MSENVEWNEKLQTNIDKKDRLILISQSSDETRSAPPGLVTRYYVHHFHHYDDILIEILQIKK